MATSSYSCVQLLRMPHAPPVSICEFWAALFQLAALKWYAHHLSRSAAKTSFWKALWVRIVWCLCTERIFMDMWWSGRKQPKIGNRTRRIQKCTSLILATRHALHDVKLWRFGVVHVWSFLKHQRRAPLAWAQWAVTKPLSHLQHPNSSRGPLRCSGSVILLFLPGLRASPAPFLQSAKLKYINSQPWVSCDISHIWNQSRFHFVSQPTIPASRGLVDIKPCAVF